MKNNGGAAFPLTYKARTDQGRGEVAECRNIGMSLRDYFAAKALQELMHFALMKPQVSDCDSAAKAACRYAKGAYVIADSMLAAREAE